MHIYIFQAHNCFIILKQDIKEIQVPNITSQKQLY